MTSVRSRTVSEPLSTRLHWTAEYFLLCGYVGLLGVAGTTLATLAGYAPLRAAFNVAPAAFVVHFCLAALSAAGWLFTGQALHARQRIGGLAALASLVPPLFGAIARGHEFGVALLISALGCLAVLTSWRELE